MLFKILYFIPRFLLLLFITLILLLVAIYFGLQTSIVEKRIIPYFQPLIKEKSGFDIQIERFRFDLFGHLYINNLSLKEIDSDNNKTIDIRLKKLNLRYDIWELINKRIVIKECSLDGLKLYGTLPLNQLSHKNPQNKPESSSLSKKQLINIVGKPPVEIDFNNLSIKAVNIDLQVDNQGQKVHYKGKMDFNSSLQWNNFGLNGKMAVNMNHSSLELTKHITDKMKLLMHPMIESNINWQIVKDSNKRLLLKLKPTEFILASGKTHLSYYQIDKKIELALKEWKFQLNLKGRSKLFNPLYSDLQWKLQQNLLASKSYFEANDTVIQINPLNLQFNLQGLTHRVQHLQNTLNLQNKLKVDLKPVKLTLSKQNRSLSVTPDYDLNLDTKIALNSDENQTKLHWKLSQAQSIQHLNFKNLQFNQGKNSLSVNQEKWKLEGNFEHNQVLLNSNLYVKQFNTPFVLKAFSINHQLSLSLDSKLKKAKLETTLKLDKFKPLLNFSLNIDNEPKSLRLSPLIDLNLPQSLDHYFKEAKVLHKIGDINVDLNGTIEVAHNQDDALDVNWSQYTKIPFKSDLKLTLKQLNLPTQGSLKIQGPLKTELLLSRSKSADYKSKILVKSHGIFYPPLKKPLPINLWMDNSSNESFSNIHSKANIVINNQPFIKYNLHLIDKPKNFSLKSLWNVHTNPKWKSFVSPLQALEKLGTLHLQSQLNLNLLHPYKTIRDFNTSQFKGLHARVNFNGLLKQDNHNEHTQILLHKPLLFKHSIKWQEKSALLNAKYNIKDMEFVKKIHLEQLSLGVLADVTNGIKPHTLKANIESTGSKVILLSDKKSPIEVSSLLLPLSLSVDGVLHQNTNNLKLQQLQLSLGGGWLQQQLQGSLSLDGNNSEINAYTLFQPREKLFKAPLPLLSGSGKLTIPWQVKLLKSKWLSFNSQFIFDNLSLHSNKLFVSDINGKLPINEEMILDKDRNISFEYLLKTDPFQRVDFNQIEPYLNHQEKLSIKTIKFDKITADPMEARIPIKQNLIQLQQFNLKLFGGHVVGELYLNTTPKKWTFGILMRVTKVDLRQALHQEGNHFKSSPISARVAMEFDFSKRLLEGQIDITDIDQSQLLQLLELVDPDHKDAQIAQLRDALRYAYPESVLMKMDGGLLNLSVSLSLLSHPITIRGLPLSPLIEKFTGNILNKVNQLPLK